MYYYMQLKRHSFGMDIRILFDTERGHYKNKTSQKSDKNKHKVF